MTHAMEAVHVIVDKSSEELTSLAVEFGGTSNWSVPLIGTGAPVQILQRRPTRSKAVISLDTLTVTPSTFVAGNGTLTAGAGSAGLPVGSSISGFTITFSAGASTAGTATLSGGVFGGPYTYAIPSGQIAPYTITFPSPIPATGTPTVTVAGLGTAAGNIQITGLSVPSIATAVILAYRPDYLSTAANPQGYIIASAPRIFQWENQQPCYAAAIGAGPITVSTVDQAQAASQAVAEEALERDSYPDEHDMMEGARGYGTGSANEY